LQNDSGTGRREAIEKAFKAAGGSVDSINFSFGDYDVVVIADMPDNITATSVAITVSATGLVKTRTTPLLTAEEVDAALKKSVSYRAPGR
jgi:uncharacterized protein with GYD domain